MTTYDWVAASKTKDRRKAYIYAALSAAERSHQTYEEFKRGTSGYVRPSSHAWLAARDRETAVLLYSIAVRNGLVDC